MRDDEEPRSTPVDPVQSRSGWVRVGTTERWEGPDGAELEIQVSLEDSPLDSTPLLIDTVGEPLSVERKVVASSEESVVPFEMPIAARSLRGTALGLAVAVASLFVTLALVWGGGGSESVPDSDPQGPAGAALSVARVGGEIHEQARGAVPSGAAVGEDGDEVDEVLDIDEDLPGDARSATITGGTMARLQGVTTGQVLPSGAERQRTVGVGAADESMVVTRAREGHSPVETASAAEAVGGAARADASGSVSILQSGSGSAATASVKGRRSLRSDTHVLLEQQSPY